MTDLDYGGRGKVGLVVPSTTWTMEPEFNFMAPAGVTVMTTRVPIGPGTIEGYKKMVLGVQSCAELLASIPTDISVLGCTSGSFVNGSEYDKKLIANIEEATGVPFTTTSTSLVKAIKSYGAKKICILTPYTSDVNQRAISYFAENEIEVIHEFGLGLQYDSQMNAVPLERIYRLAMEVDRVEADAVAILCTGLRTVPILDDLELALRKPVVSATQSSMWNALRSIKINDAIPNAGSLMRK